MVTMILPAHADVDRYRLYALIESLENDLRELISTYLTPGGDVDLGSYAQKAMDNMEADADADATGATLVHYLDLGDEIDLLNEKRSLLPADVAGSIKRSTAGLKAAVPARHRVMHFKPLLPDDLDRLLGALYDASANGVPLPRVSATTMAIQNDPDWAPVIPVGKLHEQRILNNLPLPEYDETGLIGRRGDVQRLSQMLKGQRFPVVTILGPGGVGKTALAVQTLHDLADDTDCPFDAILWVSLKTERLTADGIQMLREPLSSMGEIVSDLLFPIDDEFEGGLADLGAALEGSKVLICVDNLETATGEDVLLLIDSTPPETRFLFTSRVGVGQVERTYPLGPLEPAAAADLLRRAAKARGLAPLSSLSKEVANDVVTTLACNPLAIRWFVISVESGQRAEAILENQEDLLRFCVQNVWDALTESERRVAQTIQLLEHPVTVQELALYFDATPDDLRRQVHGLQRRALVRHVALGAGELAEAFVLSDTAALFVARFATAPEDSAHEMEQRQRLLQASEERRKLDERRAPLAPQTVFVINEVDRPAALVLRDALTYSRSGKHFDHSLELIDQAAEMSPGYYEVDRVRGFVLSRAGKTGTASAAFRSALSKAPAGVHKARVAYLFAGHLSRNEGDHAEAERQAEFADSVFGSVETKIQLALVRMYIGRLEEAIAMLDEVAKAAEGKQQRIAATQLMEARRRRAEVLLREFAQPTNALNECVQGAQLGATFVSTGVSDNRMLEVMAECINEGLNVALRAQAPNLVIEGLDDLLSILTEHRETLQYATVYPSTTRRLRTIADRSEFEVLLPALEAMGLIGSDPGTGADDEKGLGRVKSLRADKSYGFILSDFGDIFFHYSAVQPRTDLLYLFRNVHVAFKAVRDEQGRLRASSVTLSPAGEPDGRGLRRRIVQLTGFPEGRRFGFGRDIATGLSVFLFPAVFSGSRDWSQAQVGNFIEVDVEPTGDERVRGASGSARFISAAAARIPPGRGGQASRRTK